MNSLIVAIFVLGYIAIATEHWVGINKAAVALLTGVLCWVVLMLGSSDMLTVHHQLMEHVGEIAGILFFLMGAMTIVEIIDMHNGFNVITEKIASAGSRRLLWLACGLSFFLAAVLGNLTTTIVIVSMLTKLVPKRENLPLFIGAVVISVNAGGSWSPIGDVTTTMLWIGGQVAAIPIVTKLFMPSLVCALIPLLWMTFRIKNAPGNTAETKPAEAERGGIIQQNVVLFLGISCLLFVPAFKAITHLPPFVGMLFSLGILWAVTEFFHRKNSEDHQASHSVAKALQRIDMPTILFFLGILLSVAALESAGILSSLGQTLEKHVGNSTVIVFLIGLFSAVVDNVPLVAAAMKMYPLSHYAADHDFWILLSYCAGTGGSILIIGSAAGVAAMGMAKIDFFWYLKKITPLAFLGYCAGVIAYLIQAQWF
jgi:Na+/H+ antiporter NhaD/arsenite permease-like protein